MVKATLPFIGRLVSALWLQAGFIRFLNKLISGRSALYFFL
jgi:hypothetical protein